ncbi:MAG: DUF3750 domain-containing protein [Gammaproteobacteria bacterium]|nr:DUF3750 domain-containing protein [Gammaproteobacteria bacterium]
MKWLRRSGLFALVLLAGPLLAVSCEDIHLRGDWRTANRESAGIVAAPEDAPEAVVLVFAARAFKWRGIFGVHTWVATKPAGADRYTVHQVLGWRHWRGLPAVASRPDAPDRLWFNSEPRIIAELRGPAAARAIPKIENAVARYPYAHEYRMWPGPNSNTFTAYVGRQVPELRLELPPTAVGKDFLTDGGLVASAPSGTGYQVSLYGVLGVLGAVEEGIELNLLGLTFGVDILRPALKLPGLGRIGV